MRAIQALTWLVAVFGALAAIWFEDVLGSHLGISESMVRFLATIVGVAGVIPTWLPLIHDKERLARGIPKQLTTQLAIAAVAFIAITFFLRKPALAWSGLEVAQYDAMVQALIVSGVAAAICVSFGRTKGID